MISSKFDKFKRMVTSTRPALMIVLYYIGFILLCTAVLKLPFLLNPGQHLSWIDAFFMSNSAVSTTGLATVSLPEIFNYWGWLVFIIIFNIGGMGIIVMNTVIILFLGKKIGYKQRILAKMDYNQTSQVDIVSVLKNVVKFFLTFEVVGVILVFFKIGYMYADPLERLMNSMFMVSSAISGSGFYDTVPYANDYFVQWVLIFLMIFSFIGYPVIIDTYTWILAKRKNKRHTFSLFSKICIKVNIITVLLFALLFFIFEENNSMESMGLLQQLQYSFYISISTKSVGLNLFSDITQWQSMTLLVHTVFMLIGGSPSSACGGIKVTAIYIIYKHMVSSITGKTDLIIQNFKIPQKTILNSYLLTMLFVMTAMFATFIIVALQPSLSMGYVWYDVVSGFTTTGFSTGALAEFDKFSVFIVGCLMGLGRIGIMNIISLSQKKKSKSSYINYIEKDIAI